MIEAKFEYSYKYVKDLNKSIMKTYNLIGEISLFFILCAVCIMFAVVGSILMGVLASITFVSLLVSFVFANKAVERSNRILVGQRVKISFDVNMMTMSASLGGETLYNAKFDYSAVKSVKVKDNLIYISFDKKSVVIIPKAGFKTEADFVKALEYVSNNYVI